MTPEDFNKTEGRLRAIAAEIGRMELRSFKADAYARASKLTCGVDRQKQCELTRLGDLALDLADAVETFKAPR